MKYLSLFSGIGGFELGIGNRATCIGYSEIDKYAIQIYERHFNHTNFGDITALKPSTLPNFDLIVGGFPCQAFSIAGKRGGFNDTRGTLFFDIARILKVKRPSLLLLENVKGLLSHDGGRTFDTIIRTLDELGYDLQWQVLNSKNFGVPQNRERIFIIGHLRGQPRPQVFPFGESNSEDTRRVGREVAYTIDSNYYKGTNTTEKSRRQVIKQLNQPKHSNDRVYGDSGVSPALNTMQGGRRQPKIRVLDNIYPSKHEAGNVYDKDGLSPTIKVNGPRPNKKNVAPKIIEHSKIRRLTPMECERLQGFPDGWTEGVSDTQRYKTLGNAVTVNVIEAIMDKLLKTASI